MDLAEADDDVQWWRQQRPPRVQGLLALGKALVDPPIQIDLSEQNPEPGSLQNRVAAGKAHERQRSPNDHAEDKGEECSVATAAGDAALRLELVLKQFFLNLREMGIRWTETKTPSRRRDAPSTCTSRTR